MAFFSPSKEIAQLFNMKESDYQKLIDSLPCGVVQIQKVNNIWQTIFVSDGYFRITGEDPEEVLNSTPRTFSQVQFHPDDNEFVYKTANLAIKNRTTFSIEVRIKHKSGRFIWVRLDGTPKITKAEKILMEVVFYDIMAKYDLQASIDSNLRALEAFSTLAEESLFEYSHITKEFKLTQAEKTITVSSEPLENSINMINPIFPVTQEDITSQNQFIQEVKMGKPLILTTFRIKEEKNPSKHIWIQIKAKTLYSREGTPSKTVGIISDITRERQLGQKKLRDGKRDSITGLYTLKTVRDEFYELIKNYSEDKILPVLLISFTGIENVNKNWGKVFSNEILANLAETLNSICPKRTILGRLSSNDFVAILPMADDVEEVSVVSRSIQNVFSIVPVKNIYNQDVFSSIGISLYKKDGETFEEILLTALAALEKAKREKKDATCFYSGEPTAEFSLDMFFKENRHDDSFSTEITEFTMDILAQAKDVPSAMNILLKKVGRYFGLDRVCIKEKLSKMFGLQTIYEWCKVGITKTLKVPVYMTEAQWQNMQRKYNTDGFYTSQPVSTDISPEEKQKLLNQSGNCSFIHYAVFEDSQMVNTISFEKNVFGYNWTQEEIKTIKVLSKIISMYLLKMRDFTNAQNLVEKLTHFDALTGLMKLDYFKTNVIETLKKASQNQRFVILNFDIQNFKYLNEHYGFEKGDEVLKEVAEYIKSRPATYYACRAFSDNFMVLSKIPSEIKLEEIEARMNEMSLAFLNLQKTKFPGCNLTITAGCAEFHYPEEQIPQTIDNANSIRKMLKSNFTTGCKAYNAEIATKLKQEAEILNSIPNACKNGEFFFELQPKVSLATGKIDGAEALVRWNHPRGKVISPGGFIPQLEKTGLITQVDFFMYREVCRYIQCCLQRGYDVPTISVNVSRRHLLENDFVKKILNLVTYYEIPRNKLEFELTENIFLDNPLIAFQTLNELRSEGFLISIDDFGSGYSSITLVKDLTIDVLKLDKTFLDIDVHNESDTIIITSMIQMAKRLNITVLCEGAETKEQVDFLREAGCDLVQGYYFSRPISVDSFTRLYNENPFYEDK